jgi:hypothetical protein
MASPGTSQDCHPGLNSRAAAPLARATTVDTSRDMTCEGGAVNAVQQNDLRPWRAESAAAPQSILIALPKSMILNIFYKNKWYPIDAFGYAAQPPGEPRLAK